MENNETALTETQAAGMPATQDALAEAGVSAQDLVIPRFLLMQNTSEMVGEGSAKLGDIINSQTNEAIGGFDSPVEIVPLKQYKTWRVYDMSSTNPKFMYQVNVTAENERLPWEDNENGVPIRRDMCLNFFVLLVKDIENEEVFPCCVSFRRTSTQAGKQLATQMFKLIHLGRLPYSQSVWLEVSREKKDTNTYAVYRFKKGENQDEKTTAAAQEWLGMLAKVQYKVDEKSDEPAPATAPSVIGGGVETGLSGEDIAL